MHSIAVPENPIQVNVKDEEPHSDYSAIALQRLRQFTSSKPSDSVPMVIDINVLNESSDAKKKDIANETVRRE